MKLMKTLTVLSAASLLACSIPQSASSALVALNPAATGPLSAMNLGGTGTSPLSAFTTIGSLGTAVGGASQTISGMNSGVWTANFSAQAYHTSGSSGPLTFVYTITQLTGDPNNPLTGFNIGNWLGAGPLFVGAVGAVVNGLGVYSATGNTLDFSFSGLGNGNSISIAVQDNSIGWGFPPLNATISDSQSVNFSGLSVPEPTTMVAGAMLLLPFGASTLRMFRRQRTV